jgi:hypothetical protein
VEGTTTWIQPSFRPVASTQNSVEKEEVKVMNRTSITIRDLLQEERKRSKDEGGSAGLLSRALAGWRDGRVWAGGEHG